MFHFLKTKLSNPNLKIVTLKLSSLHCTSCAVNIDLTLEDLPGVQNSSTNYAKSETKVTFDSSKTNLESIKKAVTNLGYCIN
jgi:P-type Cu+ transporter